MGQISNLPICRAGIPIPAVPPYNDRNWLTSLENRKEDDTLISSYAYGHDDVGNRTSMTEANGDVTSYTYDNVYRLADETKRDSGNNVLYRYQYTYDGVGNRLTENNAGVITYSYDANSKLTQLVGPSGTTTFGYDNNGNTTSMTQPGPVTTTYGYSYENRLTSVTNPSYTAAYTYAADGLRLRVQESNAQYTDRWLQPLGPFGAGMAAQRVQPYDGVRPVLEGTLNGDIHSLRSGQALPTTAKYIWEGDSYYSPLVYSMLGGTWRYHMYDGLGSTRQLMLHAYPYTVTDTYSYEAFGNVLSTTGTTPNLARSRPPVGGRDRHGGAAGPHLATYRYVGSLGYYQTGNDLMHLGARYYTPETGRFAQQDPVRREADDLYIYCRDRPTMVVDPSGRIAVMAVWWAVLAAGCGAIGLYTVIQIDRCMRRHGEAMEMMDAICSSNPGVARGHMGIHDLCQRWQDRGFYDTRQWVETCLPIGLPLICGCSAVALTTVIGSIYKPALSGWRVG